MSNSHGRGVTRWTLMTAGALVVVLGVGSGVVHGWLDGRWVEKPDLVAIGQQLEDLPDTLGNWQLVSQPELPDSSLKMLRCYGHTYRVYQNVDSGSQIAMAVLFGPRGPIAVHTPEICYSGRGVEQSTLRQRATVEAGGIEHTVWRVRFDTKSNPGNTTEVCYAWSDGHAWKAVDRPRFWLTDNLYKIQLGGPAPADGQPDECLDFLKHLFPVLQSRIDRRS